MRLDLDIGRLLGGLARRALSLLNVIPARLTPRLELAALLERLYPVEGGHPLIRVGPDGDGGYLLPDDLSGIVACFSPGVGWTSAFEKDCAERGMNVFLADSSVDAPPTEHPRFHFTKSHLAASNAGQGSISLDSWVNESMPRRSDDLLLQMDIEGDEFEVLLSASEDLLSRFRIMAIEFHGLESLWNEPFFHLASAVFDKILQSHRCIHLHPNNCAQSTELGGLCVPDVIEITFLRRDRITDDSYRTEFPHPLDSDNSARDHLALPSCWYASASR